MPIWSGGPWFSYLLIELVQRAWAEKCIDLIYGNCKQLSCYIKFMKYF